MIRKPFLRTSKYIDPSNKFELDNQVDIYKVKTGLFSIFFCQSGRCLLKVVVVPFSVPVTFNFDEND